jgi:ribulose-phosphate 3-epimerase
MIEIIPAVMPKSRSDIEEIVARYVDTSINTIQIDLADGDFSTPKTWPYSSRNQYEEYKLLEQEGFPGWQDIDIELDLMIANPLQTIERFIEWGPSRIIIHASSLNPKDYIQFLETHRATQSFIHFGIAFSVEDTISDYQEVFSHIDFVQCMGIATIGKQGQVFDERVFEQIQRVKEHAPELPISVDGGVSPEVTSKLISAGATRLVSGSYLAKSIDIEEAVQKLIGDFNNEEL